MGVTTTKHPAGCHEGASRVVDTRWFRSALALAAVALGAMSWTVVCTAPGIPWNAARLAHAFALALGHPIYPLRDSGAHLGCMYGPVFPLCYFPTTLTSNPTLALALAALGNMLAAIAPWFFIARCLRLDRRLLLAALVFHAALLLGSPTFRWTFYFVHVDNLCLAWGLLGCAALYHAQSTRALWALHAAALSVVLAAWTKQIAVMLAPGMFLWLWQSGHRKLAARFVIWCGAYGLGATAAIFHVFGSEEVLLNTVLLPARIPFRSDPIHGRTLILDALGALWMWLPAAACGLAWFRRQPAGQRLPPSHILSFIHLLLWVAVTQLPLGITAALKVGGGVNSIHSFHYLLVAALLSLGHVLGQPVVNRRVGMMALAWMAAVLIPIASGLRLVQSTGAQWKVYRGHEELVALAKARPNVYYFPWNPLVTLIAERRVHPFDDALYCFWLAGMPIPAEHVRMAVPKNPIVLYPPLVQSKFALTYFPEYRAAR